MAAHGQASGWLRLRARKTGEWVSSFPRVLHASIFPRRELRVRPHPTSCHAPASTPEPWGGPAPERWCSQSGACTDRYGRMSDMHTSGAMRAGSASTMSEHWCGDGVSTTRLSPISISCQSVQHDSPNEHSARELRTSRTASPTTGCASAYTGPGSHGTQRTVSVRPRSDSSCVPAAACAGH